MIRVQIFLGLSTLVSCLSLCCSTSPSPTPQVTTVNVISPSASPSAAPLDRSPPATVEEDCPRDLSRLEGTVITLTGRQTRTKIPSVCGVDVEGDYDLSDRLVSATGLLVKYNVEPPKPGDPLVQSKGPGTYYRLVDARTHALVKTRPRD